MTIRVLAPIGALAVASVIALPSSINGQVPAASRTNAVAATEGSKSPAPRTPWGDPDLQGNWTSQSELGVPFERPTEFGTRQVLTEKEFAEAAERLQKESARDNAEFELETAYDAPGTQWRTGQTPAAAAHAVAGGAALPVVTTTIAVSSATSTAFQVTVSHLLDLSALSLPAPQNLGRPATLRTSPFALAWIAVVPAERPAAPDLSAVFLEEES